MYIFCSSSSPPAESSPPCPRRRILQILGTYLLVIQSLSTNSPKPVFFIWDRWHVAGTFHGAKITMIFVNVSCECGTEFNGYSPTDFNCKNY